ncbi:uncharacterized protein LOC117633157 [Prunus dulcis]|uniref:uncharacterized protein LOC117633157 n=1 Tax=Prunus dulcis TaxID=3755 RepID=UPI001481FC16|nr:uncharacterized protein LOC117633157 [Prunus dulcis]
MRSATFCVCGRTAHLTHIYHCYMPFGIQLEQTLLPISALRDYFTERTELIKLPPLEGVEYIFYNLCISTKALPEGLNGEGDGPWKVNRGPVLQAASMPAYEHKNWDSRRWSKWFISCLCTGEAWLQQCDCVREVPYRWWHV